MGDTTVKQNISNGAFSCCKQLINPYSLLNLELTDKKIHPLRWLIGFLLVSQFVVAFAYIDSSYYFVSVFKFFFLALVWVLGTSIIESGVISRFMSSSDIHYLNRARMMLMSVTLWSISLFLYITLFLV